MDEMYGPSSLLALPLPLSLAPPPAPPSFFADDDSRWAAVQSRDAVADGFFVYAVRTTKVYCRPICKARLARRANVRFYPTGADARDAGFRACKRCKPDLAGFMPEERAVRQIRAFVREHDGGGRDGAHGGGDGGDGDEDGGASSNRMSLADMAARTGLSKWHFHRVFKKCVGVTPFEYLRTQRLAWGGGEGNQQQVPMQMPWPALDGQDGFLSHDFDFAAFDLATDSSEGLSVGSGSLTTASGSGCSPLSLDDLLVWPEEMP
ncbi:helix-turn-helix, AraC type, DNA binding protein [Purpureocillium lavendulum]|uniref:Helix-turn-helix, AraC type, DNA binding protein n=1 Tax=Purpureocillium lavendulum TaxID=1247861 RepID=A0AB34FT52_9HYPO|nr:helix-turn-helix, AraC type, DNA binding protein [Purpureocillium lavendulum]